MDSVSELYRKRIRPYTSELVDILDPNEILPELVSNNIISRREQENIECQLRSWGTSDAAMRLVTDIFSRKEGSYEILIRHLWKNRHHGLLKRIDRRFYEEQIKSERSTERGRKVQDGDGVRNHQLPKTRNHDKAKIIINSNNGQKEKDSGCMSIEEQPVSLRRIPRNGESINIPIQETGTVPNREQLEIARTQQQSINNESSTTAFYIPKSNYNADHITRDSPNPAMRSLETCPMTVDPQTRVKQLEEGHPSKQQLQDNINRNCSQQIIPSDIPQTAGPKYIPPSQQTDAPLPHFSELLSPDRSIQHDRTLSEQMIQTSVTFSVIMLSTIAAGFVIHRILK